MTMLVSYRRHIVIGLQLLVAAFGAIGLLLYLIALRPAHIAIEPGTILRYRVTCEMIAGQEDLDGDFQQQTSQSLAGDLWLLSMQDSYAVIHPDEHEQSAITLADYSPLGRLQRRDSHGHLREDGISLHYFDLNLMPLPPGGDQHWEVEVFWNALPPGKRAIRCQVQRLTNGLNPRFRLKPLAPVQWVVEQPQPAFAQVRDLIVDYTYDGTTGAITDSVVSFSFLRETNSNAFSRHDFRLAVQGSTVPPAMDPAILTQLAQNCYWSQVALDRGQTEDAKRYIETVSNLQIQHPIVDGLRAQLLRHTTTHSPSQQWFLRLASVPKSRRQQAQALANELTQQGYPAFVRETATYCQVSVGPYNRKDHLTAESLARHPQVRDPIWENK